MPIYRWEPNLLLKGKEIVDGLMRVWRGPGPDEQKTLDKYHPKGKRVGVPEKAIRHLLTLSNNKALEDIPYLEQYFHPDVDILERTDLRPMSATPQEMVYRKVVDSHRIPERAQQLFQKASNEPTLSHISPEDKAKEAGWRAFNEVGQLWGLGKHTSSRPDDKMAEILRSRGEDPNYTSVYDIWDFFTDSSLSTLGPTMDEMAKILLQKVGTPYAVYDRVYDRDVVK